MTRVTTAVPADLKVGELFTIEIQVRDTRCWPRLKAWILRRPAPTLTKLRHFRVTEVSSGTAFDIAELACLGS